MNSLPTVDVVIPHYDDPAGLHRMLAAVARQTYPRELLRIIVAEAHDGTCAVLALDFLACSRDGCIALFTVCDGFD